MQSPKTHPLIAIKEAVSDFVSKESELAAAEIKPAAKAAGMGAGFFAGAAVFALHAVWMLVILIALAVGLLLNALTPMGPFPSITLGFLVSVIFSLVVAGVLFLMGRGKFKHVKKPDATIAEAKATFDVVIDRITGGGRPDEIVKVDDLPKFRDADLEQVYGRP